MKKGGFIFRNTFHKKYLRCKPYFSDCHAPEFFARKVVWIAFPEFLGSVVEKKLKKKGASTFSPAGKVSDFDIKTLGKFAILKNVLSGHLC